MSQNENQKSKKTPNQKNTGIGVGMGIAIGAAIGAVTDNLGLWIALGVAIGAAYPNIPWPSKNSNDKK
jgi:hypothetical protein